MQLNFDTEADAFAERHVRERDYYLPGDGWADDLREAIAEDDARAVADLLIDYEAPPLDKMAFAADLGGRKISTGNILAHCCFQDARQCAIFLAQAFENVERLRSMNIGAAKEVLLAWDGSQPGDAERCAKALTSISVGQGVARLRHAPAEQFHLPIVPRRRVDVARLALRAFAAQPLRSPSARRDALRSAMEAIAGGEVDALPNILANIKNTARRVELSSGRAMLPTLANEARFFIAASVRCDSPQCLPKILHWVFGLRADGLSGESDVAFALATLCEEVAASNAAWPASAPDAIIEAVADFCASRGEPGVAAIRAATASLRGQAGRAARDGIASTEARLEAEGLEEWARPAPPGLNSYRGL